MAVKVSSTGRSEALGYGPPRSYEELRSVIHSGSIRLPKRLRQIAIYCSQHPGDVALGTITSVAEAAGVQPSALVRFAQAFGFTGFSELQDLFKDHAKAGWGRPGAAGRAATGDEGDLRLVGGLIASARQSLDRAGEMLDQDRFAAAADLLAGARTVYLLGSKRAFPVTSYLAVAMNKLGLRNVLVDNVGSNAYDQVQWAGGDDAVLAVSFSPYNSITPELAAAAQDRGVPVVSLTDSALSPLVPVSRVWVEVVEGDFAGFRSLAASLAIGMALAMAVARRRELL
jgi:DNA-binding MurR/RpiR family transcriptional regulator